MPTVETSTRIAVNNVLVPTDFSDAARASLPYAAAVADHFGAKIFLTHVVKPEPLLSVPPDPMPIDVDPQVQKAQWNLLKAARSYPLLDARLEPVLMRGDFWTTISTLIGKYKIDLVVTGTRGRRGLSRLAMGSSAEKIYRRTSCPVLTIGPNVPDLDQEEWKPRRILFPTDGSDVSMKALPYALSFAEENQATLILLQLEPLIFPEHREMEETRIREAMRRLVPEEAEAWCTPEFAVRFQFPAEGILQLAAEREVDLIVMGVRKSSDNGLPDHLPWPVASQVVAEARCPVLTVRG